MNPEKRNGETSAGEVLKSICRQCGKKSLEILAPRFRRRLDQNQREKERVDRGEFQPSDISAEDNGGVDGEGGEGLDE